MGAHIFTPTRATCWFGQGFSRMVHLLEAKGAAECENCVGFALLSVRCGELYKFPACSPSTACEVRNENAHKLM
eukprot:928403-Pleurochrysis_carterae.AAC.1